MIITDIKKLRQKSEIATEEDYKLIMPLLERELDRIKDRGLGLAGMQIGYNKQIALIKYRNTRIELINPIITEKFDKFRFVGERCLSLPGLSINTLRYKEITIENGFDRKQFVLEGIESIAVQHEISHFKGRTIIDDKWRKRR